VATTPMTTPAKKTSASNKIDFKFFMSKAVWRQKPLR